MPIKLHPIGAPRWHRYPDRRRRALELGTWMAALSRRTTEISVTLACVGVGLVVSAALASKTSYALGNFIFFWLPQGSVLAVIALQSLVIRSSIVAVGGASFVLAAYLFLFHGWVFSLSPHNGMAWLGYIMSMPGAAIGGLISNVLVTKGKRGNPTIAFVACAIGSFSGLAANQTMICSTQMYCEGGYWSPWAY